MTTPDHAHRSAAIRARLFSAAKNSENVPEFAVTVGTSQVWSDTDSTPPALRALGAGALFVEYLIGFHGLHPDDAFFEAASLPQTEQRLRTNAAWHDVRAVAADRASTPRVARAPVTSTHPPRATVR